MAGPTGLLDFQAQFPERFFDVGIAEQHAVTAAAGMAMGGLKPVVAIYSTFFSRAFDQAHLDVGLLEPARRLRLRPRRHHRRRRTEPPRTPRHRALPRDSQHDGLRALDRRRGARHARDGAVDVDARPRCASRRRCPSPSTARSAKDSRRAVRFAEATARSACWPSARWRRPPTRRWNCMGEEAEQGHALRRARPAPGRRDDRRRALRTSASSPSKTARDTAARAR